MTNNKVACLTYGSYFQNQSIQLESTTYPTYTACGNSSLAKPYIDASQILVAALWSPDGSGAYSQTVTTQGGSGNGQPFLPLWENGTFLPLATNQADCDASVGTYWASNATNVLAGSQTIYLHPTAGDPRTNGVVYKVASQLAALDTWNQSGALTHPTIRNIQTCCQIGGNGSMTVGGGGSADGVVVEYGNKHNILRASATGLTNSTIKAAQTTLAGGSLNSILDIIYDAVATSGQVTTSNVTYDGAGSIGSPQATYTHAGSGAMGPFVFSNITGSGTLYSLIGVGGSVTADTVVCGTSVSVCIYPEDGTSGSFFNVTSHATGPWSVITGSGTYILDSSSVDTHANISGGGTGTVTGTTFTAGAFLQFNLAATVHIGGVWNGLSCGPGGNSFQGPDAIWAMDALSTVTSDCNDFTQGSSSSLFYWNGVMVTKAVWQSMGFDLHSTFN